MIDLGAEGLKLARMRLMHKLEKTFGRWAIPNITLYLMIGQIVAYGMMVTGRVAPGSLLLIPRLVLEGEFWRLVGFVFRPPDAHWIFLAFAWYLFFLMGSSLEQQWGAFRYNLFLLIGYIATVAAAFLFPDHASTNLFLAGSVFLAFAHLNPNFELALFLVLPVKIKWLALLTWVLYGMAFVAGEPVTKVTILAAVSNYLLFFGRDILSSMRARQRRMEFESKRQAREEEAFHRCHVCGITDKTHPQMQFRYCSQCDGHYGYCEEHLHHHEHVKEETPPGESESSPSGFR